MVYFIDGVVDVYIVVWPVLLKNHSITWGKQDNNIVSFRVVLSNLSFIPTELCTYVLFVYSACVFVCEMRQMLVLKKKKLKAAIL